MLVARDNCPLLWKVLVANVIHIIKSVAVSVAWVNSIANAESFCPQANIGVYLKNGFFESSDCNW